MPDCKNCKHFFEFPAYREIQTSMKVLIPMCPRCFSDLYEIED